MRTRLLTTVLGALAALLTSALPAAAHHAFGAEFDANRPVLLKGKIVKIEWTRNEKDTFVPKPIAGTEMVLSAQLILLAMGFLGPEETVLKGLSVMQDERTNVKAEYDKFATNIPGVFAAGDMRRGQSLIVWAINEGRGAARECDRYLMGQTDLP